MSKNGRIEKSKQLLGQALNALPEGSSLSAVRTHISRAINEMAIVVKNRVKTSEDALTPRQKWELDISTGTLVNPLTANQQFDVLNQIDQMISGEQDKINELQNKKSPDNKTLLD